LRGRDVRREGRVGVGEMKGKVGRGRNGRRKRGEA